VLLAPSPAAARFFQENAGDAKLHQVSTAEAAIELIEHRLGFRRWPG
jgi:hypothetical protein